MVYWPKTRLFGGWNVFLGKLIAIAIAYGALWDALGRWRVRGPERRLQLQVYGVVTGLYVVLLLLPVTGSPTAAAPSPTSALLTRIGDEYTRGFFAAFATTCLVLGPLELALSAGFYDPSLPLLSRWWMRAIFEGPVWKLLCQRRTGTPMLPDEFEACWRHAAAGAITVAAAVWALQISAGLVEWGKFDPVALVIILKALNIWLDARIRNRAASLHQARKPHMEYSIPGCG